MTTFTGLPANALGNIFMHLSPNDTASLGSSSRDLLKLGNEELLAKYTRYNLTLDKVVFLIFSIIEQRILCKKNNGIPAIDQMQVQLFCKADAPPFSFYIDFKPLITGDGDEDEDESDPLLQIGISTLYRNYQMKNVWDESGAFLKGFKDMMKVSIETYLHTSLLTFDRCFAALHNIVIAEHDPKKPNPENLHISLKYFTNSPEKKEHEILDEVVKQDVADINSFIFRNY